MLQEPPSAYELERMANIRRNKEALAAMGLAEAVSAVRSPLVTTIRKRSSKKIARSAAEPTRRSRRGADVSAAIDGHAELDAVLDAEEAEKRAAMAAPEPPRQRWASWMLTRFEDQVPLTTQEEHATLQVPVDWLDDFEAFLGRELGNSEANVRKVMNQVRAAQLPKFRQPAHRLSTSLAGAKACNGRGPCVQGARGCPVRGARGLALDRPGGARARGLFLAPYEIHAGLPGS